MTTYVRIYDDGNFIVELETDIHEDDIFSMHRFERLHREGSPSGSPVFRWIARK